MTATWETLVQAAQQGDAIAALERLEPLLRDVNPTLRYEGLEAMIRIALLVYARADPQEVSACYEKLPRHFAARVGDPDQDVRALALEGISSVIKRGDHETGDHVVAHLKDWRGGVRRTAVDALARLFAGGLAKDTVLTKLVACIEDQDAEVRRSTARTLVTICPEGNQATLAALAGKIKGPLRELHALATEVLWTVAKPGDAKVIKLLSHLLQSNDDPRVRRQAAMGLGKMGTPSKDKEHPNKHAEVCIEALCTALGCCMDLPIVDLQWIADEPKRREEEELRRLMEAQAELEQQEADQTSEEQDSQDEADANQGDASPAEPVIEANPFQEQPPQPEDDVQGTQEQGEEQTSQPSAENPEEDSPVEGCDEALAPGDLFPHLRFDLLPETEKDCDHSVRYEALSSLEKIIDRGDRRVLGALLVALRDPDREVCCKAVEAISALYEFVPGDLTVVIAVAQVLMQDSDGYGNINNRKAALRALITAAGVADEAMSAVLLCHLETMRDKSTLDAGAGERKLLLQALDCVVPEDLRSQLGDALVASLEDQTVEELQSEPGCLTSSFIS
ncbi:unnamed protein product [Durusdinium trenchii]|uniref:HEAT repeat domain-containing protein n=1 Tax=Durusdinium trenchii TaxID=1381693 RepID=A0ABP0JZB6_9DINO